MQTDIYWEGKSERIIARDEIVEEKKKSQKEMKKKKTIHFQLLSDPSDSLRRNKRIFQKYRNRFSTNFFITFG